MESPGVFAISMPGVDRIYFFRGDRDVSETEAVITRISYVGHRFFGDIYPGMVVAIGFDAIDMVAGDPAKFKITAIHIATDKIPVVGTYFQYGAGV